MRIFTFLCFIFLLIVTFNITSYAGLKDGQIIYFSFENVNGNTVINEANANINGTLEAKAQIVDGFAGKGLALNLQVAEGIAGDDFLRVANAPELNVDKQFTIALWAKATNFGEYRTLISKTDGGSYAFTVEKMLATAWVHVSGDYLHVIGKTELKVNTWYHFTLTFDGSDAFIYLNGKEDGKGTRKGNITVNGSDFMIGAEPSGKIIDHSYPAWHGILDEFYFYNRVLTKDEIDFLIKQASVVTPSSKLATSWGILKNN